MAYNINKSAQRVIENEGIVPYEQQTPEQRSQFLARIRTMIHMVTIGEQLRDNYPYIMGAIPINTQNKDLRIITSKMKAIKNDIPKLISFSNNASSLLQTLFVLTESTKEEFDEAGIYLNGIIKNTHRLGIDQLGILVNFTQSLINNEVQALSDEDHDDQMISFANHAISLASKGRKKITKNDLKKFLTK